MKKIIFPTIVIMMTTLSACETTTPYYDSGVFTPYWSTNYYGDQTVGYIVDPSERSLNYSEPRKYYVTEQEQQKYDHLNDRIQQRVMHLKTDNNVATAKSTPLNVTTSTDSALPPLSEKK